VIDSDDGFLPLLARRAEHDPTGLFASIGDRPLTFAELWRRTEALAGFLRRRGIAPGGVVATMLRNGPLALALIFALARARAVWVPINVQSRGDNLGYVLDHASPALIIAEAELIETIRNSAAGLGAVQVLAARGVEAEGFADPALRFDEPAPAADETFAIMYTSGTTGRPKGVLVSHRMERLAGEAVALASAGRDGDVMFMWEPLYHIGGAQMIVLPLIRSVRLAMAETFSASRFWGQVRASHATHIHYLGGILQLLLRQPPSRLDRAHAVRVAWGGGCPPDVWTPFRERFGVEIRECYGMTECASITTFNDSGRVGSVGLPLPWFRVELVDSTGQQVTAGARGEIVVRTQLPGALTRGYFKDPHATAQALRAGAFHTGDVASRDDAGQLYFHGRMTDSVRVRGENISSFEIEQVAARHPQVEDCAMVGVAAEIGEQEIKLFVKPIAGAALRPADLSRWLADRLAPYQNPRYIAIVDEFERTASARIMKLKLSRRTDDAWDRCGTGRKATSRID
jgi:crotonobetaine/carnitine-CoA ligase